MGLPKVYCAYETKSVAGLLVVPQAYTATRCDNIPRAENRDHISIVKPTGLDDPIYIWTRARINEAMQTYKEGRASPSGLSQPITLVQTTGQPAPAYVLPPDAYELQANVEVSFRKLKFNQAVYLAGLNRADVTGLLNEEARAYVNQLSQENSSVLNYKINFRFSKAPSPTDFFKFTAGSRSWTVMFGGLRWQPRENDATHWWAAAGVKLAAEDPDWVVLHDARLLPIQGGKGPQKESILETVVENLADAPLPVTDLVIEANGKRTQKCAALPPPDENRWTPPVQQLVISWPQIIARRGVVDSNNGVWTKLGTSDVSVKSRFREAGCWNLRQFDATVPIVMDLLPGQLGRIRLRVAEVIPQVGESKTSRSKTIKSKSLADVFQAQPLRQVPPLSRWHSVYVSIKPDGLVYPRRIPVQRESSGEEDNDP